MRLVALNLQAAKASILENEAVASEALARSAKDPQSFFEVQFQQSHATTKAQAYWQHVNEIATETRSQLVTSSEKLVSEYVRETQMVIDIPPKARGKKRCYDCFLVERLRGNVGRGSRVA